MKIKHNKKQTVEDRRQQLLANQVSPEKVKKPLKGVLQPNATLPGQLLCGKYWVGVFLIFYGFLWFMPWEGLYNNAVYFQFVEWMAKIYPNIHEIPETNTQFPEYAMAVVAFFGLLGPFFVVFYFYFGFIHPKSINLDIIQEIPLIKKIGLYSVLTVAFLCMPIALFTWTGDSFHTPKFFHESKAAFMVFTMLLWWCVSMWSFSFTGMLTSLWLTVFRR